MQSRIVYIKRRVPNSKINSDVYNGTVTSIGATFDRSGKTVTGLTLEEERSIMPKVLGIANTDTQFEKLVQEYFQNLAIRVIWEEPYKLEIGLDDNGLPLNSVDFVKYKFAIANKKEVALNKGEAIGNKRFYIEDPNIDRDEKYNLLQLKKEAFKEFYKLSDNQKKIDMIMAVLGFDMRELSKEGKDKDKDLLIEDYINKYPEKFIEIAQDKNLEVKAFVEDCISAEVLQKIGETYIDGDVELGKSMEEAVMFLKDKKNSDVFVKLKARLETFKK